MNNLALMYLFGSHPEGRNLVQARKWLRKAAEEPSGVFLATDKFAKELFDGSEFEEEDPDRDLSEVPIFFFDARLLSALRVRGGTLGAKEEGRRKRKRRRRRRRQRRRRTHTERQREMERQAHRQSERTHSKCNVATHA
jgi:hypothetical protein